MTHTPRSEGVDLARVALRAARDAARRHGGRPLLPRHRAAAPARRDGRDPLNLAGALAALVVERAWDLPTAGATLRERWTVIAPELAEHVAAVGYDAASGQLTVQPDSAAWATKTRLEQARIIEAANTSAGRTVVRALRILPPGTPPAGDPLGPAASTAAVTAGPVKTRESASAGYRRALAAHLAAKPTSAERDPAVAAAYERQTAALRRQREREWAFADDPVAGDRPPRTVGDRHRLALTRARAERAARRGTDPASQQPTAD
ncbi:DciA family protein [Streptomyces sp. NPDC021100]|uniref:DciA family protein n=1 Tax=Streptomyces sp. NPDC021100 TaxID=3365114 RepID=UPI00378D0B95